MRAFAFLNIFIGVLLLTGCAKYQFTIVEPADISAPIERHGNRSISQPPLDYTFFDFRSEALGVRVGNPNDEPVKLIGESSYVVDPNGQTHPMASGTIAPRSYIHFPLPPAVRVYDPGPRFTIGVGTGYYGHGYYGGFGTYWGPPYYGDYIVRPWTWRTGEVRLHLEFELEDERFAHEFLFRRERME